jgi:hypothetical protein
MNYLQVVQVIVRTPDCQFSVGGNSNTRNQLKQVFDAIRELMTPPDPPKRPIGFITPDDKKDTPKGATAGRGKKAT